uniref:Fibronectin type-III domain-containing protein n=1 Tax=Branchiostoma floridae TaxID=7739 RepID=C3ZLZ2_BRAFL|eukprot:XP_002590462.1 hypothetical protein BRAFLDRAFT_124564 [Branchiostoma floridae]
MSSCRDEGDIVPILSSINASEGDFTSGSVPSLNQAELEELKGLVNHLDRTLTTLKHRLTSQHGVTFRSGSSPTSSQSSSSQVSWWTKWSSPCIERITKHLLIITLLWQSLYVGILSLIDLAHPADNNDIFIAGIVIMITFQLVNLVLVIYTSVKLTQQLYEHKASASFLGQSYLSTVLLFAGLYTCTYRLEPKSWRAVHDDDAKTPELVVVLFIKMVFFSMSTGTLCGASDIVPTEWYNYLVVCVQMLLSFVYFASIFTMASGVPSGPGPVIMDLQVDSVALTGELERAGRRSLATSYAHGYNLPDNAGTEFLLAFPYSASIANKKALIRATSYLDTTVQIFRLNDQQIGSNITLSSAGLVHEEPLSEPVVSSSGRMGQFNSWLIKANDEVTVYGRSNEDGYMALPTDVLGKEYYVASYTGSTGRSRVVMIGVHDRTMVRITLTAGVTFEGSQDHSGSHTYSSGQDIILEVHRMETIISDKPIAALSGHNAAVVGSGDAGSIVEYLPPVYTWGKTFVVKPLNGGTDKVRVIASQPTDYSKNGASMGQISAGSFVSIDVSAVTVIQADYPVLVAQYARGGSGLAPSMTVIPPVEQYTSDYVLAASTGWTNSATVTVTTAQETGVMSEITTAVSGWSQQSGYSATTENNISPGATTFQHNSLQGAFGVVQYGTAGGESYSYPGGQRFAPINPCVVSADDGLHADGLDNDCDGLVDEGGPEDQAYSPLPPDLYVDRHSTTELDFSWRGFRMARVANFKRELGEAGTPPTVPMADVGRIIKSVESNNLFPGRKYEFKVIAVDVSGAESEPAIIVFPTDPDPPNDLLLLSITHNSISLDWNPPVVGGVTNYEVTYTNIMDGQTFTTLVPGDRTSATISGLQPMTEYQFTVTTVFFGVSSARSSQEVAVTKLEPPINMHVETASTTSSSITVSLDTVSGSAPSLTKALQFATYEISYGNYTGDAIPKPGEGAMPYRPFTPPSFEATGLVAGANYVMYVRSNYDGNSSEPVILRESTFPNPPADLWVESSGTTYIELAWDRPTSGNLEGYIITHGIVGRPTSKQSQIITDTGMTLNGLSVEHEYEIAVSVYSNGKESEAVTLTRRPSVVHVWSTWSAYSPCSQSCGDGVRTRTRQCHHVDGSPSIECEGAAGKALQTQEIACDLDHCPVHGGWTSWEAWGACSQSCGAAVQQRVRSCSDPTPVFGGKGCPGSRTQQRQCHQDPCAADGEWSEWREYSECTLECGRGTQQRTRVCLGQEGTGAPCEGPAVETRRCNEMPCPADGRWSEWSEWGQCSVSCGGGIANRTRACDNPAPGWGGRDCEGNDTEIQGCGSDPCPGEVYWSTWSDFSPCPATCGNATHSRTRACMNVDGGWGPWMEWSHCTRRCGGGTRQRTRICNNPAPEYAGQRCDGDIDGRGIQTVIGQCNEHLCSNMPKCRTVRGRCGVVWNEVEAEEIQNVSCADQDGGQCLYDILQEYQDSSFLKSAVFSTQ